jgi:hypothetical protein
MESLGSDFFITIEFSNAGATSKCKTICCRSGFVTLPPVSLQKQSAVVLLLDGALVSWSLAMDERGGHEDLRGSV